MEKMKQFFESLFGKIVSGVLVAAVVSFCASYLGNTVAQAEIKKDIQSLQMWRGEISTWKLKMDEKSLGEAEWKGEVKAKLDAILKRLEN